MDENIPSGRLGRAARLAYLGARAGAGALVDRRGEKAAARATEVLGSMRGLAAKVGQMASYVDGVVPEAQREAYEAALSKLRDAAPASSPDAIRRCVEEELGAPIDRLFAEWSEAPMASASIGQVHRATLLDGTPVAVKVQHPGIDAAIDHDLKNAGIMAGLQSTLLGSKWGFGEAMDEVSQLFREELNYALEGQRQTYFRALHADDPRIAIPRVIEDRTATRVLTTELVSGLRFEEACQGSDAQRRAWSEALWAFVFRSTLVGGTFNADPHPGNFFFQEDGTVTALDFGCVVTLSEERIRLARAVHEAALDMDEARFRAAGRVMMATRGGDFEHVIVEYLRRCFDPLFETPYRMTRGYAGSLVSGMMDGAKAGLRVKKDEFVPLPEGTVMMNRLQFGFYSVLARLDAEADYQGVERALLNEPAQAAR
ncbi:MAG: ABC1 kinase family protein [Sandaracinaceae bacterium]